MHVLGKVPSGAGGSRLGYSRYDSTDQLAPINQKIWAHKICDNAQVVKPGLNVNLFRIAKERSARRW